MARTPQDVTNAELAILQVLWKQAPATVRLISQQLYADGNPSHLATVQKLLERLEGKKYVERQAGARANEFTATINRDDLINRQLRATADKLCEGSLTPLLTHLVSRATLTSEEMETLRNLVESHDKHPKPRKP